MPPSVNHLSIGPALWIFVLVQIVWRFGCFSWQPLNLVTWPGAGFECSALAFTGLLDVWFVLADGNTWRRGVGCMAVYVVLRFVQDMGIVAHSWPTGYGRVDNAVYIFRTAEDETLVCTLVLALAVRLLSSKRVTRAASSAVTDEAPFQFRLAHLLALTGVVAVLFALARAEWFQKAGHDGFGEHQIIFLHSVTIAVTIFPALIVLRPRVRVLSIAAMFGTWASMPFFISGYFHFAQWFPWEWELVRHLVTIVVGTALTSLAAALVARWSGFRWQTMSGKAKEKLPNRIVLPRIE